MDQKPGAPQVEVKRRKILECKVFRGLLGCGWGGWGAVQWGGLGWAGLGWAGLGWAGLGMGGVGWGGVGWVGQVGFWVYARQTDCGKIPGSDLEIVKGVARLASKRWKEEVQQHPSIGVLAEKHHCHISFTDNLDTQVRFDANGEE
jgi:hypothetical protein